jgi:hypothetical protein
MDMQQVMGPHHVAQDEIRKLAPKFIFNGENQGQFLREFPAAAEFFGVKEAYNWEEGKDAMNANRTSTASYLASH